MMNKHHQKPLIHEGVQGLMADSDGYKEGRLVFSWMLVPCWQRSILLKVLLRQAV